MMSTDLPKTYSGYKLQSLNELLDAWRTGQEVLFFLDGVWYTTVSEAQRVGIAVCPEGDLQYYDSGAALLSNFQHKGVPLTNLWPQFEIASM